ncbi:acyl-CoA dehydrogenase family protein [Nesterenkonia muleiensis]|uniref:acyl-CoA dehydrogenase family protein n=1 Tax=Nesterenkonia muleiensis TaxID=2282648 RepID=UPI000E73E66C|nr:acyl-CoA dehydrogenase family protein [Nesterenkonia muleiensis]
MTTTQTTPATAGTPAANRPTEEHTDLLELARHLSSAERQRLDRISEHLQQTVRPAAIEPWNAEEFPHHLLPGLAELGLGETFADGSSPLFQGLAHCALARADVSLSALLGIHNELIVGTIQKLGSEQQKQTWLPKLRRLEALGAFCLTEPEHGSDIAGGLATSATLEHGQWRIRGSKRWIGAGTIADIALVWARDTADQQIRGFVVPTDTPGYRASKISHKTGLRIMQNADVDIDVTLPESAALPGATSFSATNELLMSSRAWVGWQAVGAQQALLDIARGYALQREQFGAPLASFQLIQAGLATVAGNLAVSTALMGELSRLQEEGRLTMLRASLAKATLTRLARESAATAREILGGNGILSTHEAAKVAADVEALYTYEGTHTINMLIAGRDLTGTSAFV